jgi:hypothetical protein
LAPSDAPSSVHKRTRACVECGRDFLVNPCHAEAHKCCRPACRARHHRRLRAERKAMAAGSAVVPAAVAAIQAMVHAQPLARACEFHEGEARPGSCVWCKSLSAGVPA